MKIVSDPRMHFSHARSLDVEVDTMARLRLYNTQSVHRSLLRPGETQILQYYYFVQNITFIVHNMDLISSFFMYGGKLR